VECQEAVALPPSFSGIDPRIVKTLRGQCFQRFPGILFFVIDGSREKMAAPLLPLATAENARSGDSVGSNPLKKYGMMWFP